MWKTTVLRTPDAVNATMGSKPETFILLVLVKFHRAYVPYWSLERFLKYYVFA